jgi:hypothetical protein
MLPVAIALIALTAIAFIIRQFWLRLTTNISEPLEISLSQPIIDLPSEKPEEKPEDNQPSLEEPLNNEKALQIINQWLDAKKQATGPDHNLASLSQILTDPQLSFWMGNSQALRNKNAHRRYEHQVKVLEAEINPQNTSQGRIKAQVKEKSQYYVNGALRPGSSYEDDLVVEYMLLKQGNQWLISETKIIQNNQ